MTLPRLTAARALAALFVFGFHLNGWGPFRFGNTGVSWFFILSGFVLAWSWKPGRSARSFWRRRFARVYPAHLAMLAVAAVLPVAVTTVAGATFGALLLHPWVPVANVTYGLNGVSWSLGCEAFFYALFPFVVARVTWARAAGYFAAASVLVGVSATLGGSWEIVGYANPGIRLGEFLLGIAAARSLKAGRIVPRSLLVLAGAVSLGAITLLPTTKPLPDVWLAPLYLALIVWAAQRDVAGLPGVMRHRWFVYAGEVSYAFYLVHLLVLKMVSQGVASSPATDLLILGAAVLAAVALHHLVELPAQRLILRERSRELPVAVLAG